MIADNCKSLRRLSIRSYKWISNMSFEFLSYFGQKCGSKLKSLTIRNSKDGSDSLMIRQLLLFTPNLVSLKVCSLDSTLLFTPNNQILLPKLKKIECNDCSPQVMIELQNRYSDQLVDIKASTSSERHPSLPLITRKQLMSGFGLFQACDRFGLECLKKTMKSVKS